MPVASLSTSASHPRAGTDGRTIGCLHSAATQSGRCTNPDSRWLFPGRKRQDRGDTTTRPANAAAGSSPSPRLPPSQRCPHRSTSRISLEQIRGKQPRERPPGANRQVPRSGNTDHLNTGHYRYRAPTRSGNRCDRNVIHGGQCASAGGRVWVAMRLSVCRSGRVRPAWRRPWLSQSLPSCAHWRAP
jgi:hypothetical protein